MKKRCLILQPDYIKNFKCIGDKCIETCCEGWTISVDKKTFKNYRKIDNNDPIKKIINNSIEIDKNSKCNDKYAKIILENNKCPFLNEKKLCKIQLLYGEKYLSTTCRQYPRIINKVENNIERSCHVSCPEVLRLLFNKEIMTFDLIQEDIETSEYFTSMEIKKQSECNINRENLKLRELSIDIIQNRNFRLDERIFILGLILNKIQHSLDSFEQCNMEELIEECLDKYCNDSIKKYLNNIKINEVIWLNFINSICNTDVEDESSVENYNRLFEKFLEGISYSKTNSKDIMESYKNGYKNIYEPFIEEKEYILENYFVNDIFSNLFPLKRGKYIFEEYGIMVIKFALIKLFLIGIGNYYGRLDEGIIVNTLYLYSRNIEHSKSYLNNILQDIKDNNNLSMAFMSILIKN